MRNRLLTLGIIAGLMAAPGAWASRPGGLALERAVLVMRHGIRAPLATEVPEGTSVSAPWPRWPVAESQVTEHGAQALALVAAQDRRLLARRGLLPAKGCLGPEQLRIRTNNSDRTVTSGAAYAHGFVADCAVNVEHAPTGEADPIFEPLRAHATRFDATAAVADIQRSTGGMAGLARRYAAALRLLDHVLGCDRRWPCVPAPPGRLLPSDGARAIELEGPIRATSGIAQVLLLQYLEGMPIGQVGWGRASAAALRRLGTLHAALFDIFTRPPYMAAHQAAPLGVHLLNTLFSDDAPRLELLMGHDTNVAALAAALRVNLTAPGYATNDVPPGGALLLERLRDRRSGLRFVRVSYRTQSPSVLRQLREGISLKPIRIPGCAGILCPADRFRRLLNSHLAR